MLIVGTVSRQYSTGKKGEIQKLRRASGRENAEMSRHSLVCHNINSSKPVEVCLNKKKKKKPCRNITKEKAASREFYRDISNLCHDKEQG